MSILKELSSKKLSFFMWQLISAFIFFLTIPLIINVLGVDSYSKYVIYSVSITLASGLSSLNAVVSMQKNFELANGKFKSIALCGFVYSIAFALIANLVLLAVELVIKIELITILKYSILASPFHYIYMYATQYLVMSRLSTKWGICNILYSGGRVLVVVLYASLYGVTELYSVILVDITFVFLSSIILLSYLLAIKVTSCNKIEPASYFYEVYNVGIKMFPHSIGAFLSGQADKYLVFVYLSPTNSAFYILLAQTVQVVRMAVDSINKSQVSKLYRVLKDNSLNSELYLYFKNQIHIDSLKFLFFVLFGYLISVPFVFYYFSIPLTAEWLFVVALLLLGQYYQLKYYECVNELIYFGRTGELSISTVQSSIVSVSLSLIITPLIGPIGSAFCAFLSVFVVYKLCFSKVAKIELS